MKNITKIALSAAFVLAITFIISCIPPMIEVYPTYPTISSSSIVVDDLSSSETAPSSSSSSFDEPSSSSSIELSSSSVLPSSSSSSSAATYAVKYEANGGVGAPYGQEKIHDIPLTLNGSTPTRTGYTFVSWNTAADGSGTPYHPGASYTGKTGLTLYAHWKANTYTVKYDANGGTGAPPSQEKIHNISLTLSGAVPTRQGYIFVGWNTAANGNGVPYLPGAIYTGNAIVTLYAQWKAIYIVKYDANGGIGAPPDQEKIHDIPLILSGAVPTRSGYTFVIWNTAANGSGTSYAPNSNYTTNANVTLYAQWKADIYIVKYNANGGNFVVPRDQEKIHDIPLTLNSTPPKTGPGYEFVGWNTAANGGGTPYIPGAIYPDNTSVTLYAQWRCKADVGPSINYVGENYNSVVICSQTWMAKNLNYSVDGSSCYDNEESNCKKYGYGRLYNWATAMALSSSCNLGSCSSQIGTKHKGICPTGWHIPSKDEWSTLVSNVERSKGCTNCAAKHLKATSGWDGCSASGTSITSLNSKSCLDSYGFSAFPGGGIATQVQGIKVKEDGSWWSTTERSDDSKKAYNRYAHNSYENFSEELVGDRGDKVNFFSVRCVKD